jgi:hypothetical protein
VVRGTDLRKAREAGGRTTPGKGPRSLSTSLPNSEPMEGPPGTTGTTPVRMLHLCADPAAGEAESLGDSKHPGSGGVRWFAKGGAGRRVRVVRGPLEGSEGILIRRKGVFRVVISVNLIMRSIVAEVDATDIESFRMTQN